MKQLLLVFLLSAAVLAQGGTPFLPEIFYGETTNWVAYGTGSLKVDVDFSGLGLTKTPLVFTTLECFTNCFTIIGATSIYNLDKDSFSVFLKSTT